jgi:hypothetical protein
MANRGAGGQLLRDKRIYIAAILIFAWIFGAVIARPFYDDLGGGDDDDGGEQPPAGQNFVELGTLAGASTRIVIATYGGESSATATATPADGVVATRRRFTLVESLRGGGAAGESLEVWGDPGPGPEGELALEPGEEYLLFLVQREFDGQMQWSAPGEPFAASVGDNGRLQFVVSDRYAADMRSLGWTSGEQRVPFEATLEGVQALAAGGPAPTATAQ